MTTRVRERKEEEEDVKNRGLFVQIVRANCMWLCERVVCIAVGWWEKKKMLVVTLSGALFSPYIHPQEWMFFFLSSIQQQHYISFL